jgi:centromeric protein E
MFKCGARFLSMQMGQEIKELTQQCQLTQSRIKNSQQSVGGDQFLRIDEYSISESSDPTNPLCLDLGPRTCSTSKDLHGPSMHYSNKDRQQFSGNSEDNFLLDVSSPKFVDPDLYRSGEEIAERADADSEDNCKEVRCIEVEESPGDQNIEAALPLPGPKEQVGQFPSREAMNEDVVTFPQKGPKEATNVDAVTSQQKGPEEATSEYAVTSQQKGTNEDAVTPSQKGSEEAMDEDAVSYPESQKRSEEVVNEDAVSSTEKVAKDMNDVNDDNTYNDLKQRIQSMQKAINRLISFCPSDLSPSSEAYFLSSTRSLKLARSKSCRAILQSAHWFEKTEQNENTPPAGSEKYFRSIKEGPHRSLSAMKFGASSGNLLRKASQNYVKSASTEEQNSSKSDTGDAKSTPNFTARQSEAAKPQSKRLFDDLVRRQTSLSLSHTHTHTHTHITFRSLAILLVFMCVISFDPFRISLKPHHWY